MAGTNVEQQHSIILDVELQGSGQSHQPTRRLINWNTVTYCDCYSGAGSNDVSSVSVHLRDGQEFTIEGTKAVQGFLRELQQKAGYQPSERTMTGGRSNS